jgi:hypothetical protein
MLKSYAPSTGQQWSVTQSCYGQQAVEKADAVRLGVCDLIKENGRCATGEVKSVPNK